MGLLDRKSKRSTACLFPPGIDVRKGAPALNSRSISEQMNPLMLVPGHRSASSLGLMPLGVLDHHVFHFHSHHLLHERSCE